MKQSRALYALSIVIVLGGLLRLYALGSVPHGLAWDEAAIGYNGFAIVKTRRDEWLQRLPVSFRSFGDYKAPLAIYINGLSTKILGLHPLGVRLPFAVAGTVSIGVFAAVLFELWRNEKEQSAAMLVAATALMTSPWHTHYSRVAFESGIALFLLLCAVFSFLRFCIDSRITRQLFWVSISAVSASLSLYTYHSSKITTLVLLFGMMIMFRENMKKRVWAVLLGALLFFITILPLLRDSIFGDGLTRANVTIFSKTQDVWTAIATMLQQLLTHLDHRFLVLGQTTSLRHGDGMWGVLLPTTYFFALLAVMYFAVRIYTAATSTQVFLTSPSERRTMIAFLWIIAGLLPAAIGTEVPHSNRALLALPGFLLLAVEGVFLSWHTLKKLAINQSVLGSHGEKNLVPKLVLGTLFMAHSFIAISYISDYFTHFPKNSTAAFSDGYLEAMSIAAQYEKGTHGRPEVDTILFSDAYGQPYIYALFVRRTDPIWYQGGSLIKYQFSSIKPSDLLREKTLVVATPGDGLPVASADHVVYGSDGSIRFLLFTTPK